MATCHVCPDGDNTFPDADTGQHARRYHPDEDMEYWPDGAPVVVDGTLQPADFGGDHA